MRLKSEKRQCEPQRVRALWLSAGPGGDWTLLLEAGAGAPAGNIVPCAKRWAPRARALALLLEPVSGLPAPQGATFPPCLPYKQRQLLPLARALRARCALPPGERQGDLAPRTARDWEERGRRSDPSSRRSGRPAGPSGGCCGGSSGCPRAGLRYSPASGPCLSFGASDRCLTRKSRS